MAYTPLTFSLRDTLGYVDGKFFSNQDISDISPTATALSLEGSKVDDLGIQNLTHLRFLRCLDLDSTNITDKALETIATLTELEELWLECTAVTDVGIKSLHPLSKLKLISLAYTHITSQGIENIRNAIPGITIST